MRQTITLFLIIICGAAIAQPTLADTTKIHVFDRTNSWFTTGALLKAYVATGGSGDITNGGNTTGAEVIIGTNDANPLSIETNGVKRFTITGGASTGGAWTATDITANTNTVETAHTSIANSTGTAAAGFGIRHVYQLESSTTDAQDAAAIGALWTVATHASRSAAIQFSGVSSGGALGEIARITATTAPYLTIASAVGTPGTTQILDAGITPGVSYSISGTPTITVSSSSTSSGGAIRINSTGAGIIGVNMSGAAQTSTTLGRRYLSMTEGYAAASGSGTHNQLFVGGTFNMTGTSSGANIGVDVNPTLTSLVTAGQYVGLNMPFSNTNAIGINQTGANTPNYLVGGTTVGSTTAVASAQLSVASTTKGFLPPRMTSTQKEAISSPADGLEVWDTDLIGKCVWDGVKWLRLSQRLSATIAAGTGAGTSPTISITGTDLEGIITLTLGSSPANSATVFTVTFGQTYDTAPTGVIFTEMDADSKGVVATSRYPFISSVGASTFVVSSPATNGLSASTQYIWAYKVIQ